MARHAPPVAESQARHRVADFLRRGRDREEWFVERQNPEIVFADDRLSLAGARAAVEVFPGWTVCADRPGFEREVEPASDADALAVLQYLEAITRGEPALCDVSIRCRGATAPPRVSVAIGAPPGWGVAVRALDLVAEAYVALEGVQEPEAAAASDVIETFFVEQPEWQWKGPEIERSFRLADRSAAHRFAGRVLALAQFHPQRPASSLDLHRCVVTVRLGSRDAGAVSEGALDVAVAAERLAQPVDSSEGWGEGWDHGECPSEER